MKRREFLGAGAALLLTQPAFPRSVPRKSCIFLNLVGGPSHLDTWDMKPDAPSSIRGPFRPIRTNVPGIEISEIFPRMAKHADKFALIRSCRYDGAALHDVGRNFMQTGRDDDADVSAPHIGDVIGGHVILPFRTAHAGGNIPSVQPRGLLLAQSDFDLHREPEHLRHRYGLGTFGQSCLMARRLVQAGARFVTVNMFYSVFCKATWDSHGASPFSSIADYRDRVAPVFDRAYSALLKDLHERDLLATTLVAGIGEFGRSPKINPSGGRDHWPQCFTVHLAGGGIRGGQVYGSSDATGAEPRDNPVSPAMVAATIYKALGVEGNSCAPALEPLLA